MARALRIMYSISELNVFSAFRNTDYPINKYDLIKKRDNLLFEVQEPRVRQTLPKIDYSYKVKSVLEVIKYEETDLRDYRQKERKEENLRRVKERVRRR